MSIRICLVTLILGLLVAGHDEAVAGQSHGNNRGGGHSDRSGGARDSSNRENYWHEQAAKTEALTPANEQSATQPWSSTPPRGGHQIGPNEVPRPQDRHFLGYRYYQDPSAPPAGDDLQKLRNAVNGDLQELAEPLASLTQPPETHEADPKPPPLPPLVVPKYFDPDKPAKESNF